MNKVGVGHASVTELEKKYVMDALDNERLSQGKYVALFEKEFAKRHDQKYGVMLNSGTSALHIALEVLKETEGWDSQTQVLVPAITFIATSNACIHAGLNPVFVDVDPITYNMDPNQIKKHITANTKAIIPVHAFGQPCEMDSILEIAREHGLKIIEDCAESHFASYKGKTIGSFSDISAFSTYVAHTITTGVGGLVLTDNGTYMEIARSLIAHGRSCTCEVCLASNPNQVCPKRLKTDIDKRFMFERIGFSYRVGEIEGALGLAQLERADEIMKARRDNSYRLTKELEQYESLIQLPKHPDYIEHTYMMYPIVIRDNASFTRKALIEHLEKNNIETRPMLPLLNQPIYKKLFGDIEKDYPVAKWINTNGFYVGTHHGLDEEQLVHLVNILKTFLEQYR